MIFVTTGTQEPFDRLIETIDDIAGQYPGLTFVVQAFSSLYKAKNFDVLEFISAADFSSYMDKADLIISHAGMGTIISALVENKPIIVMPRLLRYNEHRNEHQLATARKFDALGYLHVAYDEHELMAKFITMWPDQLKPLHKIGNSASDTLLDSLRTFIE
ncbi:glycosyltransferase [Mucilaginibacter sp. SP1R1]|uniref:glycosyltransferase n=1 Tax=Mucilaginibacter sp. SP1R1 TaxID=2723091 RepID=UPI001620478E|nr:glycosyltransferase [Mucilaginibacter sp. SP1R1]MBB6148308.1 UDP-N-acetylglucosamine transferase subunit ALG13 [Mucilaginibacter sp. SP1R1]